MGGLFDMRGMARHSGAMPGRNDSMPVAADTALAEGSKENRGRLVLWIALPVVATVALWGLLAPEVMTAAALAATSWVLVDLGWLILLLSAACVLLCGWLAMGPWRHHRLGGADERPEFGMASWIAMLFAAGMGTGLVVWGAAEPAVHMLSPPGGPGATLAETGRKAMILTHFHWGVHAWSIYALCALVIGWFAFRRGRPALVSAPLQGLLPGRAGRALETGADVLGILAVTFGIAGTLVMGMLTIRSGLAALGLEASWLAPAVLALVGAIAMASASTGIGAGIRILSDFNIGLALLLMGAVLLLGPTVGLLDIFVNSLGGYLAALPELSFRLRPFAGQQQWTADWTLTYLLWWLAWGPFVGVFIARISKGRTVAQFVAGVVLVPTLGSMLWFSVLGGSVVLQLIGTDGTGVLADAVRQDPTTVTFVLLNGLPGGAMLSSAAVLLLLVFLVTSIDSGAWVLGMMSANGAVNPPVRLRLAWGAAVLLLAAGVMAVATLEVGRAMAILGALPFPLILLAQAGALVRDMGRASRAGHDPETKAAQRG
jgi:glycine betaine transporter